MCSVDRELATALAGIVLLCCGACSQRWTFARADYSLSSTGTVETPPPDTGLDLPPTGSPVLAASYRSAPPVGGIAAESGTYDSMFPSPLQPALHPLPPVTDDPWHAAEESDHGGRAESGFGWRLRSMYYRTWHHIYTDYANYYSWITLRELTFGVALAAPLANTSLDVDFQNWYQREVRSSGSDDFAAFWKTFGEGQIFIPAFAGLGLVGRMFEDRPLLGVTGEFGDRVTRAYLVGAPPMVFMQYCLGGSRPDETGVGSQWKPFDDSNAVSGHAFIGAVPFITAAKMCENRWAKSALYICSTFTAWSRVNDHDHYLSQAALGWWMAYLASRSVEQTEYEDQQVRFSPMITPELTGVGMVVQR